jgi:PKD repeat protein
VHLYTTPGIYTVSLEVNGGEDTCTKKDYITVTAPLLLGDANDDGVVNQADTLRVIKEVVGIIHVPPVDSDAFVQTDVHHNNIIDIGDAMFIAQYNVGLRDAMFELRDIHFCFRQDLTTFSPRPANP